MSAAVPPAVEASTVEPPPRAVPEPLAEAAPADSPLQLSLETAAESPPLQPVLRPADHRPRHDAAALAALGIGRLESRRLVLYSDVPTTELADIPPLVDAAYQAWTAYFGEQPPARDGSEFQMTGYLMGERSRFEAAGLVPDDLPAFLHGRHSGLQFWMNEQPLAGYRRHLALHEATHCFMTVLPGGGGPPWYMEGMAELFGTHRLEAGGPVSAEFRVLPDSPQELAGWGRISLVRAEVEAGRFLPLDAVFALPARAFLQNEAYAWSWAACYFFDAHPRLRDRFRELADVRLRRRLPEELAARFAADRRDINDEWALFIHGLRYGYDLERAAIVFAEPQPLTAEGRSGPVAADRGWQSGGVVLEAGRRYAITASGSVTLADTPQPWSSLPRGISFDYFDGYPLGRLLATVRASEPVRDDESVRHNAAGAIDAASGWLSPIDLGTARVLTAPVSGVLYFRVNDAWDRLADNTGAYSVRVTPLP